VVVLDAELVVVVDGGLVVVVDGGLVVVVGPGLPVVAVPPSTEATSSVGVTSPAATEVDVDSAPPHEQPFAPSVRANRNTDRAMAVKASPLKPEVDILDMPPPHDFAQASFPWSAASGPMST